MSEIANKIDHTCLKPEADRALILKYCEEAKKHGFASVCVNPWWVSLVQEALASAPVKTCTVIGFPLGATYPTIKAKEVLATRQRGADEFDMVLNISALKSGDDTQVEDDIRAVVDAAEGLTVKVILETCLLTSEEIVRACEISERAGAHFVKTSTGFSKGGATVEAVSIMKKTVGDRLFIKASGGIKTRKAALELIQAGASRIGASSSTNLLS